MQRNASSGPPCQGGASREDFLQEEGGWEQGALEDTGLRWQGEAWVSVPRAPLSQGTVQVGAGQSLTGALGRGQTDRYEI